MDTTRTFSEYFSPNRCHCTGLLRFIDVHDLGHNRKSLPGSSSFTSCFYLCNLLCCHRLRNVQSQNAVCPELPENLSALHGFREQSSVLSEADGLHCGSCRYLARPAASTSRVTSSPVLNMPLITCPTWPILPPSSLMVSSTLNSASAVRITPLSPSCPPMVA